MRWKHFRNTAHVSGHNQESAASCLKDGNAERFGQAGVEEDMSPSQDIPHFVMGESSEKLNSSV